MSPLVRVKVHIRVDMLGSALVQLTLLMKLLQKLLCDIAISLLYIHNPTLFIAEDLRKPFSIYLPCMSSQFLVLFGLESTEAIDDGSICEFLARGVGKFLPKLLLRAPPPSLYNSLG